MPASANRNTNKMPDNSIKILTPQEVNLLWPKLAPGILRALSRCGEPSGLLLRDVAAACFNGNAKVLVADTGYGVVFMDGDVCNLLAYSGTLKEIKLLKDYFVEMARASGCKTIRITGDPAWMRVVPGLRQRSVVMELDISVKQ
jgi:hypothetical protein